MRPVQSTVGFAQVLVDVNWRPVFWEGHEDAPARIKEYVDKADIIKLSEEEAEFIYGVPCNDALFDPIQVGFAVLPTMMLLDVLAGWVLGGVNPHWSGCFRSLQRVSPAGDTRCLHAVACLHAAALSARCPDASLAPTTG